MCRDSQSQNVPDRPREAEERQLGLLFDWVRIPVMEVSTYVQKGNFRNSVFHMWTVRWLSIIEWVIVKENE